MKQPTNAPEILDLDRRTADEIVQRLESSNLPEQDCHIILASLAQDGDTSGGEGASGEGEAAADEAAGRTAGEAAGGTAGEAAGGTAGEAAGGTADEAAGEAAGGAEHDAKPDAPAKHRKGHGRNGINDFPGAERQVVLHPTLQAGDDCPQCGGGTVYLWIRSSPLIRFVAQPPIQVTIVEL